MPVEHWSIGTDEEKRTAAAASLVLLGDKPRTSASSAASTRNVGRDLNRTSNLLSNYIAIS